jgi:hypothetical protein
MRFDLHHRNLFVPVRLYEVDGRWLASADTPDGPSLRTGWTPLAALVEALEPFDGIIDELLQTAPPGLLKSGALDQGRLSG